MTSHTTPGPLSRRSTIAALTAGGLGLAMTVRSQAAIAQDTTPSAQSSTALVGAWQWNSAEDVPELSTFAIFHGDGTYTEWQPVGGTAIGIWRMTGERTADLVFVFPDTDPSLDVFAPGTATFTITIELDETGNALNATGTVDVRDAGGVQLLTVPWTRPAVRMTFDNNPSTGSIPATPDSATPSS